jgi:phosphatidylserine/phosphatidylglycerophosphate/cardiolipin synthase-like enzyme
VPLLRTYPRRRPRYPYAPAGERSIALGYTKALGRAQRLVYIEDQYLWSFDDCADLRRRPAAGAAAASDRRGSPPTGQREPFYVEPATLGHAEAMGMVREAGRERVQILDVENHQGLPVYVHSKICVIDDVWAAVGSDNFNTRSWTHDSELTAAVLDAERDAREPTDPAGLGDGRAGSPASCAWPYCASTSTGTGTTT